ncbi:MAG TPA: HAD-IB family hydrolase [Dermatophilaceae bacterium]|nr:HAD-IB family hydrolase [Dermatophilaceae bacterium]
MTRSAAFFDLDRTLIRGSATFPLAVSAFRAGWMPPQELLGDVINAVKFMVRGSSDEGSVAVRERVLRGVAGRPVAELEAQADHFVPKLAEGVLPESRKLLAEHAARGDDRIVVSASPQEIVIRLAEHLGLEGAVGTRSEIVDGKFTGRLAGAFCYGEGKVTEIRRLADERGYDLALCTAYSDSMSDLPFLLSVGTPVAVNPDRELRALARVHGWTIVEVRGGRPSVSLPFPLPMSIAQARWWPFRRDAA